MKRFLLGLGVLVVVALFVVGCGASPVPTGMPLPAATRAAAVAAAPTVAADGASLLDYYGLRPAEAPAAPGTASESLQKVDAALANAAIDRLIIRNGNMTVIVKDVTDSVNKVTDIAAAAGGYILKMDSGYQGDSLIATVAIKVPAETFDDVMAKLRKLAIKVEVENTSRQDVTEEFVDLDARMKVYEATEQQLLTFLEKTQNVDESLKVYRELTNVRSQIESVKGRMNYLQKSAAMSNITVQVKPEPKEQPIVEESGWNPMRVVRDALRSLVNGLQSLAILLIYLALYIVPLLIILLLLVVILRAIWRRLRRMRAK